MACAQLLAMCLLPAKAGAVPHREPLPIFHDVSSRRRGAGPVRPRGVRGVWGSGTEPGRAGPQPRSLPEGV